MASRRFNTRANWRKPTPRRATTRRFTKGGRPWSSQEIAFMRKYYRNNETSWVARQLGRTVYSVRYKASSLSIRKSNPSVWKGVTGFVGTPKNTKTTRNNRPVRTRYARPFGKTAKNNRKSRTRKVTRTGRY